MLQIHWKESVIFSKCITSSCALLFLYNSSVYSFHLSCTLSESVNTLPSLSHTRKLCFFFFFLLVNCDTFLSSPIKSALHPRLTVSWQLVHSGQGAWYNLVWCGIRLGKGAHQEKENSVSKTTSKATGNHLALFFPRHDWHVLCQVLLRRSTWKMTPRVQTFKVTHGHWKWHGSIHHLWLPIKVP